VNFLIFIEFKLSYYYFSIYASHFVLAIKVFIIFVSHNLLIKCVDLIHLVIILTCF